MTSDLVIEVSDLELRFGGMAVLQGVSAEVESREIIGLVGPNGAGKTSLLNCLNGVYRPTGGRIAVMGQRIDGRRVHDITRLGVARTFQGGPVLPEMSVVRYVMLGNHLRTRQGVVASALGIPVFSGEERGIRSAAHKALDFLGLGELALQRVGDLPYGQAKLIDLARALVSEPRILLLDEPASGLGDALRQHLAALLRNIRSELGITQVVVEHDMGVVQTSCDRVVVLDAGKVLATGEPKQVIDLPSVRDAFLGKSLDESQEGVEVTSR